MENSSSRKIDVTLNQPVNDEEGISFADIWHRLKRKRFRLLAWVLVAVLVGGVAGTGYVLLTQEKNIATSIISFNYDGIENGLDPAGAMLDINKLKSPQVIEPALTEMGWAQDEKVLNVETIRQAITIAGLVPQDVIDRLTVITTIAKQTPEALAQVLDVSYYPTQFKVTLDTEKLKLSKADGCALVDAILNSYRSYFFDTYANTTLMSTALNSFDYTEYDYVEATDVLSTQLDVMISYVDSYRKQDSEFRSVVTGYSLGDIIASLEIIDSVDLGVISSQIFENNLTKDKSALLAHYKYSLTELNSDLSVANKTLETINSSLKDFQKDTVLMNLGATTDAAMLNELTLASTAYDELIMSSIDTATEVATINARIATILERMDLINNNPALTQAEYNVKSKETDGKLMAVSEKIGTWVNTITETMSEYFETVPFRTAYTVLVPAQGPSSQGRLMSIVKYGAVGAVGAAAVVMCIYVIVTIFGLSVEDKKGIKTENLQGKWL